MNGDTFHESSFEPTFRKVPRTGVIFVMAEAAARGFSYGNSDWANLGQGAPEVGPLPGAPDRLQDFDFADSMFEYGPVGGLPELREAVAELYNDRYRRGMGSRYSAENVAISAGGRAGLTRIAASLGHIHLGHFLPDYTAYEELLETFRGFVPIPILLDASDGFQISIDALSREVLGKGLDVTGALPQRRQVQVDHVEAIIEVFAKVSLGDGSLQIHIRGCNDSHVHIHLLVTAYSTEAHLL